MQGTLGIWVQIPATPFYFFNWSVILYMRVRKKKPEQQLKIARERIDKLFDLAEKEFKKNPERSIRYIELARKIGMRYNVRLPKQMKRKFCKSCNILLKPGVTSKVRIDSKNKVKVIKCLKCNRIYRYPYKKRKK
jgi:ribonuclease P protein subunit RPR2